MKPGLDNAQRLAIIVVVFAALVLFAWIPFDVETGIVEKVRRRYAIGDALAPTVAAGMLLFSGVLLYLNRRREGDTGQLSRGNLGFLVKLLGIIAVALLLMRFSGPLAVAIASALGYDVGAYRNLRDTVPWKYVGYFLGGVTLVAGLITLVERRFSWRAMLVGIAVVFLLTVVYDLPFEDLLLPPNGDV